MVVASQYVPRSILVWTASTTHSQHGDLSLSVWSFPIWGTKAHWSCDPKEGFSPLSCFSYFDNRNMQMVILKAYQKQGRCLSPVLNAANLCKLEPFVMSHSILSQLKCDTLLEREGRVFFWMSTCVFCSCFPCILYKKLFMCTAVHVCHVCACARGARRVPQVRCRWSYRRLQAAQSGCWELNPGPRENQQTLLTHILRVEWHHRKYFSFFEKKLIFSKFSP